MNVYKKGVAVLLSKNFNTSEFDCNGKGCCTTTLIEPKLVEVLQNIRDHFGGKAEECRQKMTAADLIAVKLRCNVLCHLEKFQGSGGEFVLFEDCFFHLLLFLFLCVCFFVNVCLRSLCFVNFFILMSLCHWLKISRVKNKIKCCFEKILKIFYVVTC